MSSKFSPQASTSTLSRPVIARTFAGDAAPVPACFARQPTSAATRCICPALLSSDTNAGLSVSPDISCTYSRAVVTFSPRQARNTGGVTPSSSHSFPASGAVSGGVADTYGAAKSAASCAASAAPCALPTSPTML